MDAFTLSIPVDPVKWLEICSVYEAELKQKVQESTLHTTKTTQIEGADPGNQGGCVTVVLQNAQNLGHGSENLDEFQTLHDKLSAFVAAGWDNWTRYIGADCSFAGTYTEEQKAWTGRLVSKPFHQGFPRPLRAAVSEPGHVIVAADWRSAHLWIMGCLSEDDKLLDFLEASEKPYMDLAKACNLEGEANIKNVKIAMLGYLNGMGDTKVNAYAPGLASKLTKTFKAASAWRKNLADKGLVKKDGSPVASHERIAGELQRVEAIAAYNVYQKLNNHGLKIINIIYDEILFSIPVEQVAYQLPLIRSVMAYALLEACEIHKGTKLTDKAMATLQKNANKLAHRLVKISVGKTWGSVAEYSEEMIIEAEPVRPATIRAWANEARVRMTEKEIDFSSVRNQWAFAALKMVDQYASRSWLNEKIEDADKAEKRVINRFIEAVNSLADKYLIRHGEMLPGSSEQVLAEYLYESQNGNLKADVNHLYFYNAHKKVWSKDESGVQTYTLISKLSQKPVAGEKKVYDLSASRLNAIKDLLRMHTLKHNPWKQTRDGVVVIEDALYDVEKGWVETRRDDCILDTMVMPYTLNAVKTAPEPHQWIAFMRKAWDGTPDLESRITFMQEFLGICMAGMAPRFEKAVMLTGHGANGKSTFVSVASECLFLHPLISRVELNKLHEPEGRVNLIGKRINIISDMNHADLKDTGSIKQIWSGEEIEARSLYQAAVRFKNQAGFIMSCNNIPRIPDTTQGVWRRLVMLSFPMRLKESEIDVLLSQKLCTERVAIFAWALKGLARMQEQQHYSHVKDNSLTTSKEMVEEQAASNNPLKMYVESETEPCESTWTSAQNLYTRYAEWCKKTGHQAMSLTRFGTEVKQYIKNKRTSTGMVYAVTLKPASW